MSENLIPFDIPLDAVTIGNSLIREIYCNDLLVYRYPAPVFDTVLDYSYRLLHTLYSEDYSDMYDPYPTPPSDDRVVEDLNELFTVVSNNNPYDASIYLDRNENNIKSGIRYWTAYIIPKITGYNLKTLNITIPHVVRNGNYIVTQSGIELDLQNVDTLIISASDVWNPDRNTYEDKYWNNFLQLNAINMDVVNIELRLERFHQYTANAYLSFLKYTNTRKNLFKDTKLCHWIDDYVNIIFPDDNSVTSVEGMFSNARNVSWQCDYYDDCGWGYKHHHNSPIPDNSSFAFIIKFDTENTGNIKNYNNFFADYNSTPPYTNSKDTWGLDELRLYNWRICSGATFNGFLRNANLYHVDISGWTADDGVDFEGFLKNPDDAKYNTSISIENCNFGSPSNVKDMFSSNRSISMENCIINIKSNITDTSGMFCSCSVYELDTSNWDVSNVTNMSSMFYDCYVDKLDLSNWDVSNVTNMSSMFYGCSSLSELDVSNWDVISVADMSSMFYGCSLTELDVSGWDTSNVNDMSKMFYDCGYLTELDLSNWNPSNLTNTSYMFYGCNRLTELDLSNWEPSNLTNTRYMFYGCSSLTELDLSNWDLSNATDIVGMLSDCSGLVKLNLSGLKLNIDTGTLYSMFEESNYTSNVKELNLSGLDFRCLGTNLGYFEKVTTLHLSDDNIKNLTDTSYLFKDCKSLTTIDGIANWDTSYVTDMNHMFENCYKITRFDFLSNWDVGSVTDMSYMFHYTKLTKLDDIVNWDFSSVTNMSYMFQDCKSLTTIDGIANWEVSNVTDMSLMFNNCESLTTVDLSNWKTNDLTTIYGMFSLCYKLTAVDLSNWNTSNMTDTRLMFSMCWKLRTVDLSNWDTINVNDMSEMFYYCNSLTELDLSGWDTSNVSNASGMFIEVPSYCNIKVGPKWTLTEKETGFNGTFNRVE